MVVLAQGTTLVTYGGLAFIRSSFLLCDVNEFVVCILVANFNTTVVRE